MSKTLVIIQARLGSTRLPEKVLFPLLGRSVLWWIIERLKPTKLDWVMAYPISEKERWGNEPQFYSQARENDVLTRYYDTARHYKADTIIRITGDCPCIDAGLVKQALAFYNDYSVHYVRTDNEKNPHGFDVEIFSKEALERANHFATHVDREHVCTWMRKNLPHHTIDWKSGLDPEVNYSIDCYHDYRRVHKIFTFFKGVFGYKDLRGKEGLW